MFLQELTPIVKQLTQHPISFVGGFVSGVLRLNLADDPVKSWLDKQTVSTAYTSATSEVHNGKTSSGPQTIAID